MSRPVTFNSLANEIRPTPAVSNGVYRAYLVSLRDAFIEHQKARAVWIRLLQKILRRHKLPLYWKFVALLAIKEAPGLFESLESVRGLLYCNPDVFIMTREGVFILAKY